MTTRTIDIFDPGLIADPYGGYGRLREEAAVVRGRTPDGHPLWLVTRQDEVRALLGDHRAVRSPDQVPGRTVDDLRVALFASIGIPPEYMEYLLGGIAAVDGGEHTRVRKLVSRAFTVRRVAGLLPRVEEIAAGLLDRLADPADLVEGFAYPLPITVICELVGVPEADRPDWRRWATALVTMNPETIPAAMREMIEHCHDLVARRRSHPEDDLLSGLVTPADDGDVLTDVEIVTMLLTLVFAGHETTAHLISNGTLALLQHPDQLDLLRREPALWPGAVGELMRWCAPVLIAGIRYAAADIELGGVTIPAGDAVQPVLVSANYDPRVYPDPERFDVTRHPAGRGDGHVGFGHGPHYCLGAALARQEAEVALRALFDRFPRLRFAGVEPEWARMPGSRRLTTLPVHLGRGARQ